ncbi:MAG: hypothetical protein M3Q47_08555 [Actinomycetota bacterium]|nr:hypothetical protein [Actinomycetota bacterium]
MADLREATRQTVHLAVLDGTEVVYVEILRDNTAPRMPSSEPGGRLPAHDTAVGRVFLAFSGPDVVDDACSRALRPVGPRTITAPELLRRELDRIHGAGIGCAASPVLGTQGTALAGISISGWHGRLDLPRIGPAVRTAALALGRELRGVRRVELDSR